MSHCEELITSTDSESDAETTVHTLRTRPVQLNIANSSGISNTAEPVSTTDGDQRSAGPSQEQMPVADQLISLGILPINDGYDSLRLKIAVLEKYLGNLEASLVCIADEHQRQIVRTTIATIKEQMLQLIHGLPSDSSDDNE